MILGLVQQTAGIETVILGALFAGSAAVAYSGYQKAKKAAARALQGSRGIMYQTRATIEPRRLIFGEARVGGVEAYFATTGDSNEFLHFMLMWSEGENEEVSQLYLDGEPIDLDGSGDCVTGTYAGLIHAEHRLGAPNQTAIANAVSEIDEWTDDDILAGISYSWVRMKYDPEVFVNGTPSISARLKGLNDIVDVYDDSIGYTNNSALCMARYMTHIKYGMALSLEDDFDADSLLTARNRCNEDVTLSIGGTEKRYTFNGVIQLDLDPETILDRFITTMAGNRVYTAGKWNINAGEYIQPSFEITADMLVSEVEFTSRPSKKERINEIRGVYVSPGNNFFPTDFPAYSESQFVSEDGLVLPEDLELIDINSVSTARRLSKIFLRKSRYGRRCKFSCNIEALSVVPGRPSFFTFPKLGFDSTPVDILDFGIGISESGQVSVSLEIQETNSDIYDWSAAEDEADSEPTTSIGTTGTPISGATTAVGGINYLTLLNF